MKNRPEFLSPLWIKMQIQYIERTFGRKLKREEVEALIDYFKHKTK